MTDFVPYQEAIDLKELGFNKPCICGYSKSTQKLGIYYKFLATEDSFTVDAPTFSQTFRWFREKHKLFHSIEYSTTNQTDFVITINKTSVNDARDEEYKTYEEAELACLRKMITLCKKNKSQRF